MIARAPRPPVVAPSLARLRLRLTAWYAGTFFAILALLEFLVRHRGQVVDRAAISAHVWDENHDPFTNVLEVLVRRLRRKIDEGFEPKLIQTLRGAGYRLGE